MLYIRASSEAGILKILGFNLIACPNSATLRRVLRPCLGQSLCLFKVRFHFLKNTDGSSSSIYLIGCNELISTVPGTKFPGTAHRHCFLLLNQYFHEHFFLCSTWSLLPFKDAWLTQMRAWCLLPSLSGGDCWFFVFVCLVFFTCSLLFHRYMNPPFCLSCGELAYPVGKLFMSLAALPGSVKSVQSVPGVKRNSRKSIVSVLSK